MDELILVRPSLEYDSEIMKFRKELMEAKDEDYFAGCGSLKKCDTTREWLSALAKMENEDTCPKGYVPSSTYLAVRTFDNRAVGIIDLRHHTGSTPVQPVGQTGNVCGKEKAVGKAI